MRSISIIELLNGVNDSLTFDGVKYRFKSLNNGYLSGSYKRPPFIDGDWSNDGTWEIVPDGKRYELVTTPSLSSERLFISFCLVPESLLEKVIGFEYGYLFAASNLSLVCSYTSSMNV